MNQIRDIMTFTTETKLPDYFRSIRAPKLLIILPNNERVWTMNLLISFLNDLNSFTHERRRCFTLKENEDKQTVAFFYFKHRTIPRVKLFVQVLPTLEVKISTDYVVQHWTKKEVMISSNEGIGGKICKIERERLHFIYTTYFC